MLAFSKIQSILSVKVLEKGFSQCITVLFNFCVLIVVIVFSFQELQRSAICRGRLRSTEAPAAFPVAANSSFQSLIPLFFPPHCICQIRPHLLLHSAGLASLLYQSRRQRLCLLVCYRSLPCECSYSSGRRGFIDELMSREGAGKWIVTSEEFDWLSARAPRWTDAAIKQAPLSLHLHALHPRVHLCYSLTHPPERKCSEAISFSLLLSFWGTSIHISAQFCLTSFTRNLYFGTQRYPFSVIPTKNNSPNMV